MSVQPPPTNTTSPIYNPINYVNPTGSNGITISFLDQNYLKFPTAQGSEEFTDGLFTTNTIDFNSSTGTDREITGLSKSNFTDILGNTSYTSYIEENSTAIGAYDGGLIINSSNSINLVGTTILANGSPIGTGTGNVSTTSNNTFVSPATTQTFNNQSVVVNSGSLSFTNNGTTLIGGKAGGNPTPSYIYYPTTFPTGSTSNNGLAYFWNNSDGGGEVSMICYAQGAGGGTTSAGGLQIYSVNSSPNPAQLLASFLYGSSSISSNTSITGIISSLNQVSNPTFQSNYSSFYSLGGLPYFGYNNGGTYTYQQLTTNSSTGQLSNDNTAIGKISLASLTTGVENSAYGSETLNALTNGNSNTALGFQSLTTLIGGDLNTAIGWGALAQSISDNNNVAIGYSSGFNLVGNGTNSNLNTFVGWNAGINQTSGSNNIAIGQYSGVDSSTPTISNTIAIGNITAVAPLDIILGSSNLNYVKFYENIDHYELSSYMYNAGNPITNLYVNGFAQQPSTSTPSYLPTSYGTFYNNGGLPYFAYNNAGTITSQQLATTNIFITANWTASLVGGNTQWSGYIPSSITANSFSFYFYSNTPTNNTSLGIGDTIVAGNSQLGGFGVAYRQNYITAGAIQYGYVFTILNYNGLSISSPNISMYSVAIYPPNPTAGCCFCYLTNVNDGGFLYTTSNNGLTLIITNYN